MALLWADGFDHYGSDEQNMLDGAYASMGSAALSTAQFANGTHSLLSVDDSGTNGGGINRFVLPTAKDKMGICFRIYLPTLPEINTVVTPIDFLSGTATLGQVSAFVTSTGAISFYRRNNYGLNGEVGTLIAQSDPVLTAGAWHFVEIQVYIHDTAGWVRVAVNGVHRYEALNLDTKIDSTNIAQIGICNANFYGSAGIYNHDHYIDDLYAYDFVGSSATDTDFVPTTNGSGVATGYIGELQVLYQYMDGDTAETDWIRISGSSDYSMVDETDPNDSDYVYSTTAGDLSEFEILDLPEEITYIRGVMLLGRLSKADAGAAFTKFGMKSNGDVDDADERPVTVEPTYWWDFMNVDPDTGARWTRASFNAAKFRLTRSV